MAPKNEGYYNPKNIHVTDVGDCIGKTWYQLNGVEPLKYSKAALRNIVAHNIVTAHWKDMDDYLVSYVDKDKLKYVNIRSLSELKKQEIPAMKKRFKKWFCEISNIGCSIKVGETKTINLRNGFKLSGTPDIIAGPELIYFRGYGNTLTPDLLTQLGGYHRLFNSKKFTVVFIGKEGLAESRVCPEEITQYRKNFDESLKRCIEERKIMLDTLEEPIMNPKNILGCTSCRWRQICDKSY
jgi:hypothetical protein